MAIMWTKRTRKMTVFPTRFGYTKFLILFVCGCTAIPAWAHSWTEEISNKTSREYCFQQRSFYNLACCENQNALYEYAWKIKRNHFLAIIIFHIFFSTFVTIFRLTKIKCMRKSVFHENYTRFFFFVYRLVLFSSMRIDWLSHFYALIAMCAFNFVLSVQISTFKLLGRFNILFLMFAFIVLLPSYKPLAFTILFFWLVCIFFSM